MMILSAIDGSVQVCFLLPYDIV